MIYDNELRKISCNQIIAYYTSKLRRIYVLNVVHCLRVDHLKEYDAFLTNDRW